MVTAVAPLAASGASGGAPRLSSGAPLPSPWTPFDAPPEATASGSGVVTERQHSGVTPPRQSHRGMYNMGEYGVFTPKSKKRASQASRKRDSRQQEEDTFASPAVRVRPAKSQTASAAYQQTRKAALQVIGPLELLRAKRGDAAAAAALAFVVGYKGFKEIKEIAGAAAAL